MSHQCRDENDALGGGHGHSHGAGSHGHSHSHEHDKEDGSGMSLYQWIDRDKVSCLNEKQSGMAKNIIKSWEKRKEYLPILESEEDDAELLLHIPFTAAVKLRSFCFVGGDNGQSPHKVKFFVNRDDIDFDIAREMRPTQEFELHEDFDASIWVPVIAGKFNNITSLTIFIGENQKGDDDSTVISYLGLKGEGTQIRRAVVETTYEASAQMKDHKKVVGDNNMKNYLS
mmetsp:Transcript_2899/g.3312  ORF Transcript_2899/g.3312 Transcript_2899/m.3312 type:complete len:228 (+) Transcript_2899:163-846(+)|eukprot:CAMPEP_0184012624 /NCGR_PEP_ID=MMETSP0954-20121128/4529_1 /TAXON_ID=627963 /ORGANISM="Aplanochytrium sp, Strain PBS07" /LENGTH=227 /DNA_ID=CAMNT_0026292659 /DNA_START=175 /DNA_END=858 /DNA_ORIENTATION=+